jgi:copper homeostasis protein
MQPKARVEVCVDSVESALAAQAGGAHRVELCAGLIEGGTTPSTGAIELARRSLQIDLNVIVRPRAGDFCYSDVELEVMERDIAAAKALGVNGVVIGILKEDGAIDVERTRRLVDAARPMSVTFHRAFDMSRDPHEALEALVALGIERVLTKGQEDSIWEGLDLVARLVAQAGERLIVMPGGGRERNVRAVVERTGAREIHVVGRMLHRNLRLSMGGAVRPPEFSWAATDPARIRAILDALR